MNYVINGQQYTQGVLSLFKILPMVKVLRSVPTTITTNEELFAVMETTLPSAFILVLKPVGTRSELEIQNDIMEISPAVAVQVITDFLDLNQVDPLIETFSTLFTRLSNLATKIKTIFG